MAKPAKKLICSILTLSIAIVSCGLSARAEGTAEKKPYDEVLPKAADVEAAELERIGNLAKADISAAAEEINTLEDDVFLSVVRNLLNGFYADAKKPDIQAIKVLKEKLGSRADVIFAGYDAALEERLNENNLSYEVGTAIVCFEKNTSDEDVKEIADRMGASMGVLMKAQSFSVYFDFGIGLSVPMAVDTLNKIDCVVSAEPNGISKPLSGDLSKSDEIKAGSIRTIDKMRYKILDTEKRTAALVGTVKKKIKKLEIKAFVQIGGKKFKIVSVGKKAFWNVKSMQQVVLGKNIVSIEKKAFAGCSNLKKIQIKSKVLKNVHSSAFQKISKNAEFSMPDSRTAYYQKLFNL